MVSDWLSVIAVPLNVGDGACLIKSAKLYKCTQTHYKHDVDGRTAPGCARPCFRTAEPLGEDRYENWITHFGGELALSPTGFVCVSIGVGRGGGGGQGGGGQAPPII